MLASLLVAALLQAAAPAAAAPKPAPEEIVVTARSHKCSVAIADHVLSDPEFNARMEEWARGVPVLVRVPSINDMRCMTQIMFRLADHGVTRALFVDR